MTVVATAGHVDHGKSALVLALTGTDPDRLAEERRRGLTIDLGFAHTTLPSGRPLSIVDVPGHVRFLPNMIAGVGAIGGVLFVVDAGEGWKPQSEEHLRILELLGVEAGIVVLTKRDRVDGETLAAAELDVRDHLEGSPLAGAPLVAVSALTGEGIDVLVAAIDELWATTGADDRGRPRLWIDRVFSAPGAGTVVTGTLAGGALTVDDAVAVEPGGAPARIRELQIAGRSVATAEAGTRVAVNVAGIDVAQVGRGAALVEPGRWRAVEVFDASVGVLADLDHALTRRGAFSVHVGTAELAAKVRIIGDDSITPGAVGLARLRLAGPLPLLPGDRFILRESGRSETVGGGEILDIAPVLPVRSARPDRSVERVVAEHGWLTVDDVEALTGETVAPTLGRWVAPADRIAALADAMLDRLDAAGAAGLDIAALDDRERAVVETDDRLVLQAGTVRRAGRDDEWADHPFAERLRIGRFAPPDVDVPRSEIRELVRRGLVVERDGVCFHPSAIDDASSVAANLLAVDEAGFTVSQFREAIGSTRKFAVPLVAELDARGVTRRRGDLHIAGPRLPGPTPINP